MLEKGSQVSCSGSSEQIRREERELLIKISSFRKDAEAGKPNQAFKDQVMQISKEKWATVHVLNFLSQCESSLENLSYSISFHSTRSNEKSAKPASHDQETVKIPLLFSNNSVERRGKHIFWFRRTCVLSSFLHSLAHIFAENIGAGRAKINEIIQASPEADFFRLVAVYVREGRCAKTYRWRSEILMKLHKAFIQNGLWMLIASPS